MIGNPLQNMSTHVECIQLSQFAGALTQEDKSLVVAEPFDVRNGISIRGRRHGQQGFGSCGVENSVCTPE